jgi:hypothetical protein
MKRFLCSFCIAIAWGLLTVVSATIIHVPGEVATIQEGILQAHDGDTVLVDTGVYSECINFRGKEILVASNFIFSGDTTAVHHTIIDGGGRGTVVNFTSGEGEGARLIGFTVTNGFDVGGGGIECVNRSRPLIAHNVIRDNRVDWYGTGGGIRCENAAPTIVHNLIARNNGAYYGGGIYLKTSSGAVVEHNRIVGHMTMSGYGIAYGAGLYCEDSDVLIRYNLFRADTIDFGYGGAIACQGGAPHIINNTIVDNAVRVASEVGGIYCMWSGSPVIVNNIIAGNEDYGIGVEGGATPSIDYNDLWQNGYSNCAPGPHDLSCDPQFCDPENLDFTLHAASCCVGAGQNGEDIGAYGVGCGVLSIDVVLDSDTTHRGEEFGYTVTCRNYTDQAVRFRFETYATYYTVMYPLVGPVTLWIPPGGQLSGYLTEVVPRGAPFGDYFLCATIRDMQGRVYDVDCEPFAIVPGLARVRGSQVAFADWITKSAVIGDIDLLSLQATKAGGPERFALSANYPNPFNAITKISYTVANTGNVSLKVYDITGRLVCTLLDRFHEAGEYDAVWDASDYSSGVYFYKLQAGDFVSTKKMNLLK